MVPFITANPPNTEESNITYADGSEALPSAYLWDELSLILGDTVLCFCILDIGFHGSQKSQTLSMMMNVDGVVPVLHKTKSHPNL